MTSSETPETSLKYLQETIKLARKSPPKPTNFRVGCVIVAFRESGEEQVLSTGYTLELSGNTHAEQCALTKIVQQHSLAKESDLGDILTSELNVTLFTSLEPCGKRLSGNLPCVSRIIATRERNPFGGIRKVVFGAKEPGTFVQDSQSCKSLSDAGIDWEYLPEFETEILAIAMEGHQKDKSAAAENTAQTQKAEHTNSGSQQNRDEAESLPVRDEATQPRNPKKRMMEAPPGSEVNNE